MTTTQNTNRWITFHTDKAGREYATYFSYGRNFRTNIAEARMMVAIITWTEEPEVKW